MALREFATMCSKASTCTNSTSDKSYCKAPITPGIFEDIELGNADNEYFKCHGAQMYYIFGAVGWNGLPLRDESDLPFSNSL
jgi:hypothetical protein